MAFGCEFGCDEFKKTIPVFSIEEIVKQGVMVCITPNHKKTKNYCI